MNSQTPGDKTADFFRKSWSAYRKILEGNYMSHVEAYGKLRQIIISEQTRQFSFLDLACGDAYYSSKALDGTLVSSYTGIDLSETALEIAEEELKILSCNKELKIGDFSDLPNLTEKSYEIIWLGLSLHHLETAKKAEFLNKAYRALSNDGTFLIYEPIYLKGEDRAGYNLRIENIIRNTWSSLSEEQVENLLEHVRTTELPETVDTWIELGKQAGFSSAELIYQDPSDLYGLFTFKK